MQFLGKDVLLLLYVLLQLDVQLRQLLVRRQYVLLRQLSRQQHVLLLL